MADDEYKLYRYDYQYRTKMAGCYYSPELEYTAESDGHVIARSEGEALEYIVVDASQKNRTIARGDIRIAELDVESLSNSLIGDQEREFRLDIVIKRIEKDAVGEGKE